MTTILLACTVLISPDVPINSVPVDSVPINSIRAAISAERLATRARTNLEKGKLAIDPDIAEGRKLYDVVRKSEKVALEFRKNYKGKDPAKVDDAIAEATKLRLVGDAELDRAERNWINGRSCGERGDWRIIDIKQINDPNLRLSCFRSAKQSYEEAGKLFADAVKPVQSAVETYNQAVNAYVDVLRIE